METNTEQKAISIVKKDEKQTMIIQKGTSLFFDIAKFEHAQRVAQVFAKSSMVPEQFQNNIANCVIALNLSERMEVDPFMLMQNMYIVYGRPGIEAKLAIALINQSGRFSELEYEMIGSEKDGDGFGCKAYATKLSSGQVLYGPKVDIAMAKAEGWYNKQGSKWKTMKEIMLQYRSAMFFARIYCPDLLLGMLSREELHDIIDITPQTDIQSIPKSEKPKVGKETYTAIKIPKEEVEGVNKDEEDALLIASFSKLNKVPLQNFEKVHRNEIATWSESVQEAFHERWEAKTKTPYEVFLRRLDIINGNTDTTMAETPKPGQGTVICKITGEAKTFAACANECPNSELFEKQECLERFPE